MNKFESSLLTLPALAVSEMRGKYAARAAPMLALAAISCCSAARTSGRRCSSSDGKPAGSVGERRHLVERGSAGRQVGWQRLAHQQHQRVLVERALALRLRQRRACAFDQRLRLAQSSSETAPLSKRSLRQAQRLFARVQRLRVSLSSSSSASSD